MLISLFCLSEWVSSIFEPICAFFPPEVRGAFYGTLFGASLGAFGAYLVNIITFRKMKASERWKKHRNAHQKALLLLNEHISLISDNKFISESIIKINNDDKFVTYIAWKKPHPFPAEFNELFSFLRNKLVNDLFSYVLLIKKMNNDIASINLAYSEITKAKLGNGITKEQYNISFKEYQDKNADLMKAYNYLLHKTYRLLAYVRVSIDKDKILDKKYFKKLPDLIDINESEIQSEIINIKNDIDEVAKKSRKELDEHGLTKRRNC